MKIKLLIEMSSILLWNSIFKTVSWLTLIEMRSKTKKMSGEVCQFRKMKTSRACLTMFALGLIESDTNHRVHLTGLFRWLLKYQKWKNIYEKKKYGQKNEQRRWAQPIIVREGCLSVYNLNNERHLFWFLVYLNWKTFMILFDGMFPAQSCSTFQ